jgi:UrcA family protein
MTSMRSIAYGLCAATALAAGAPAMAQGTSEEIVVIGRYGSAPDSARTLSQAVSYADLDLSTASGRSELRHRVKLTARFLCDKMGESGSSSLTPSCRDEASSSAMNRVGTIEQGFAPRGTTWVRPPAWQAPYPATWVQTYP